MENKKVISKRMMNKLASILDKKYKRVTLWGSETDAFVECKGMKKPSKNVEKILANLGLKITSQRYSYGSDYGAYYYWIAQY